MSTSQIEESTATCEHEAEPNECAISVELFIKHFIINDIVLDKDWMGGIRDNTKIAAPLYVAVSHVFRSKHVVVELCVFFDDKRTRSVIVDCARGFCRAVTTPEGRSWSMRLQWKQRLVASMFMIQTGWRRIRGSTKDVRPMSKHCKHPSH